jgi:hypothetical protein
MPALPLDDTRWGSLQGGYRLPYDASIALRKLLAEGASTDSWGELWEELHHQGDLGQASYAAVPWLVEFIRKSAKLDWNAISLIATIELARDREGNPAVDDFLADGYFSAIRSLPEILASHPDRVWDELTVGPATACVALARGQRWFARAYFELDRATAERWFSAEFGWDFPDG